MFLMPGDDGHHLVGRANVLANAELYGGEEADRRPHQRQPEQEALWPRGEQEHAEGEDRRRAGHEAEHRRPRVGVAEGHAEQRVRDHCVDEEGEADPGAPVSLAAVGSAALPDGHHGQQHRLGEEDRTEQLGGGVDVGEVHPHVADGHPRPHDGQHAEDDGARAFPLREREPDEGDTERVGDDLHLGHSASL